MICLVLPLNMFLSIIYLNHGRIIEFKSDHIQLDTKIVNCIICNKYMNGIFSFRYPLYAGCIDAVTF